VFAVQRHALALFSELGFMVARSLAAFSSLPLRLGRLLPFS